MTAHLADNNSGLLSAFLAYRGALFNTVVPIVGCRHWAEDVVQDAYLKITESGITGASPLFMPMRSTGRGVRPCTRLNT